ncbi:MAG: DUF3631 domain-containing protein [Pseudomonadota bacterium]
MASDLGDAIEQFRAALQSEGLNPPEVIEAGKFHHFPGIGKRIGNKAGWCKLFDDGLGGCFGDWASNLSGHWQAKQDRPFSPVERDAFKRHVAEANAQSEAERKTNQADAANEAAAIWQAAHPAPDEHAYLTRKHIKAHGARLHNEALVIPVREAGVLRSLQFIRPNGDKRFLTGGRVAGCYFSIGATQDGAALCIAEGFATGATIHEATGNPVAVAFNARNLEPVARALRAKFPDLRIIVLGDNDESGTGQKAAEEAARAVGGMVAIPSEAGKDWNDVHREQGVDAVKRGIEAAQPLVDVPASGCNHLADAETLVRLAKLSPLEYDRARKAAAEQLCIRTETLDKEVRRVRGDSEDAAGEEAMFSEREAWPESVNGAEVLDELARAFNRFAILPKHADVALVLWCASTYLAETVDVAPILALASPEKRCGKTTVLSLLARLVHRPLAASNISPAALFRCVEKWGPTLLIDEADAFLRENEELRGIINSGHTRDTAFVIRTVGDEHEPRRFSTWGPKAIALIGTLPDTLADRAVAIELRRKMPSERVEKLRHAEPEKFDALARQCARFAADSAASIRATRPALPDELHDRAADNWEPLLAIADAAGGDWPDRARRAASVLSGATPDGDGMKVELLRDVRAIFERTGTDRIGSTALAEALAADKESRWSESNHGKPITQRQLARLLRPFVIVPNSIRMDDGSTPKGYQLKAFADAFARYLPAEHPPSDPQHCHNPVSTPVVADKASATGGDVLRFEDPPQTSTGAACGVVAVEPPSSGEEERF